MLASGDTVLLRVHPESSVCIATSKREVSAIGENCVSLDEKGSFPPGEIIPASDLARGGTGNELGDDLFVCHGEAILG